MHYRVKNCVSRPNVDDVRRQLQGPNKNVRKSRKNLGHNSGLHAKNKREISRNKVKKIIKSVGGGGGVVQKCLNTNVVNQYDKVQELQITYFCGTEWECGDGQSWKALQKAKVQKT